MGAQRHRQVVLHPAGRGRLNLGHFAENDPFEPSADVDALQAALRGAGRPAQFHRYPGTGHWFAEPDRTQAYDGAAATLAWQRTLAFLRRPPNG